MRTPKKRRLYLVLACLVCLGGAVALSLAAFSSSLTYFLSPRQVEAKAPPLGRSFRLGGIVEVGTVATDVSKGEPVTHFAVTDGQAAVKVIYTGVLPDLFREGQGVVAIGSMQKGDVFRASEVLAKHGADYMPKDVEEALKKSGKWNPRFGPPPNAASWDDMSVKGKGA
ncbi:cytochrome c maturation protein CcmE [Acidocella aminolytica]|jgi:cytochrome c-type biogenesis protein CcmE|uniref:Cytochrome c-type biogenesis protein CcmE n=1 Tax=Acidocella aminolytica 101 = DSM 11237 TaxID=1120923 RepID=A0A0D6PCV5_9PROT|nr:cytochrome c maturation protein CcmE [Acidocella aminolytica]GAN78679.1 cytochrome c-type biogenesis protein CcmE/CycJ [Acidocella aminolytica 101 = DSM 11237]GBQ36636.1 cytochrome c-type biogenesis protein CcmE [Acidocella aminolytica 101 = DSM 11237]SHE45136.1 cytochrome c-type biogenesis protein CcmE [Acidocella aminolytica 101 = DSM 11237]